MGFLDNLFSNPFDFNGDGKMSADESFAEFMAFNQVMKESEQDDEDEDSDEDDDL